MASAAAALLDELMGKNRNNAPGEKSAGIRWSDDEVCKNYLVDFCPHELFVNTRSDLGQCEKIHDDHLKREYKESSRFKKMGYEEEFMSYLQRIMSDVEKRIKRGHTRLTLSSNKNLTAPNRGGDEEQLRALSDRINSLLEQVEKLGCEGRVDEAQSMMKLCDKLTRERAELQTASSEAVETLLSQEKQMEVCEVCGAFLIVGDSQTRVDDHLMGKQHMGFAKIKATVDEIRNKRNQEIEEREEKIRKAREEREKEREKEREERRKREREKEKEREKEREERRKEREKRRDKERSSRRRSRSRSRDRRRSRSRERRRSRSRDRDRRRSRSKDRHRSSRRSRSSERKRSSERDRHSGDRDRRDRNRSRSRDRGRDSRSSRSRESSSRTDKSRERSEDKERRGPENDEKPNTEENENVENGEEKSEKQTDQEETDKMETDAPATTDQTETEEGEIKPEMASENGPAKQEEPPKPESPQPAF